MKKLKRCVGVSLINDNKSGNRKPRNSIIIYNNDG